MNRRLWLLILIFLLAGGSLVGVTPRRAEAFVTHAGGETIAWSFQGIPDGSFFHAAQPCQYRSDTNYWGCEYGLVDPPYFTPVQFSASITPTKGSYPALSLYYSGATEYPYNRIRAVQGVWPLTLENRASFYIPASARTFRILYSSNGSGTGETNIQINVSIANYDPNRANLLGGKEINSDTEYCDESGQPGKPRIRNFNNRKGAGPGKCSRMGLPRYLVNSASLSLVLSDTDFEYGGLGPAIDLTRTYNSNATAPLPGDPHSDMFGNRWSFSYDGTVTETCQGAGVTRGDGSALFFSGSLCPATAGTTLSPPPGSFDSLKFLFDEEKQKNYWLYERKQERLRYRYELLAGTYRLASITDRNGLAVTIDRNSDGTISTVTDAAGRITSFTYAGERCLSMTVPSGKTASYQYDAAGNLVRTVDLAGNATSYAYDDEGYLTSMTLGDKVTRFAYDPAVTPKRIVSVTNALGQLQSYRRSGLNETTVTDPAGNSSVYRSGSDGRTEQTLDAYGESAGTRSFSGGLLTGFQSPGGWSVSLNHDSRGNLISSRRSSSYGTGWDTTSFGYDARENMVTKSDPADGSRVWRYEYDAGSNLTRVVSPSGATTSFGYSRGLLTSLTDPRGKTRSFGYDSFGNNTSSRDPLGNVTARSYDAVGNLTGETDPAGNRTSYQYDANSRLTRITHPDGSFRSFHYDCCSLTGITDENGRKTSFVTNKLLQPVQVTDPLGNAVRFDYDATNTVTAITRPDQSRITILPDRLHRPAVVTDPLGNSRTIGYDGEWNVKSLKDERGNVTEFLFDQGRPSLMLEPSPDPGTFQNRLITTWDGAGRIKDWINSRFGGVSFAYTPDGRLASKSPFGSAPPDSSYSYDAAGNLVQMDDRWGRSSFGYDDAGRTTAITYPTAKEVRISYTATGRVATVTYPTGVVAGYSYDSRNRVKSISFGGQSISFGYDAVGNLLTESRSNGVTSSYSHDARDLVTGIAHARGSKIYFQQAYLRDAMGNVTRETGQRPLSPAISASAAGATYNAVNQQVSRGGDSFSYDPDGNLTAIRGGRTLVASYDQENRLASITRAGAVTDFTYNGKGERVKAVRGTEVVQYHYDSHGRMLFTTDGEGTVTASYFYSGDRLVAISTPQGYFFYHFDQTGNTVLLTDSAGNPAAAYAYLPYGESIRLPASGFPNPFTYVGAYGVMDDGGGLYHMATRSYDAVTGRFLQKDRTGFAGGSNLYAYAAGNPVLKVDPKGTNPLLITGALLLYGAYQGYRCVNDMLSVGRNGGREAQRYADRMTLSGVEDPTTAYDARDRYGDVYSSSGERLAQDAFNLEMTIYTTSAPTRSALEAAGEVAETVLQESASPDPSDVYVPGLE